MQVNLMIRQAAASCRVLELEPSCDCPMCRWWNNLYLRPKLQVCCWVMWQRARCTRCLFCVAWRGVALAIQLHSQRAPASARQFRAVCITHTYICMPSKPTKGDATAPYDVLSPRACERCARTCLPRRQPSACGSSSTGFDTRTRVDAGRLAPARLLHHSKASRSIAMLSRALSVYAFLTILPRAHVCTSA